MPKNGIYRHCHSMRGRRRLLSGEERAGVEIAGLLIIERHELSTLCRSGLCVSDLCLGAMTFGEDWGWGTAKDERPVGVHFRA
jgi:hypothetical protein